MRKYILISALLVNSAALSQEAQEFHLTVNGQELNTIAVALGERPYKDVAVLLQKLDAQIKEQRTAKADKPLETQGKDK